MSALADRVLAGLGPAFRRNAGDLLPPLVESMVAPAVRTDELVTPTPDGWATMFDLDGPNPGWLAQLVGVTLDPTAPLDQQRERIRTRTAWKTGTYRALVATLRTALQGDQRVEVIERDPDPWHAHIRVYETDYRPGTTADLIRELAERHRPVGVTFDFTFYPPSAYQEAEDTAGTYTAAEATAGTYQSAED